MNWRTILAMLLLVTAMVAVFGRVCGHQLLIWDDDKHLVKNPHLNPVSWRGVGQLWREPYRGLYIPLSYTFFAAEVSITRQWLPDDPDGAPKAIIFHLGNLALHVACVFLVFTILRLLFSHEGAACAGALLFGLHPVQVESVAWASETRGVLCALFSLAAVWQYLRYAGAAQPPKSHVGLSRQRWHYLAAMACFLLALLCKPAAVAVPLIIGALSFGLRRRPARRVLAEVGFWLVAAAGCLVVTKLLQPDRQLPLVPPYWARPLLAGDALAFYLVKLIAPWRLGPDYGRSPAWVMQQGTFYVAWLLPAAVLCGLAGLRHRRLWLSAAAVSLAWVLPVLGLVPFVFQRISTVADRYLYLALLGPALVLTWLLTHRWNRETIAATAVMLSLLGVLSWSQTAHWRDNHTLIAHGLWVNPKSSIAQQHRGHLLAKDGEHTKAIRCFRQALQDHPTMKELHLGLRASLVALGKRDEAVAALREAVRQIPRQPVLRCELADELAKTGARDEAVWHYRQALQLDPRYVAAHIQWGNLLLDGGAVDQAIVHFRSALQIDPNHVPTRVNLGIVLSKRGEVVEARHHYETALKIRPGDATAHYSLGNLLLSQGALEDAAEHYRSALQTDPDYAKAHVNLGVALLELGESPEALRHFRLALKQSPNLVEAHYHLGRTLAAEGRQEEATAAFRRALRLLPADSPMARQIRQSLRSDDSN